jgi:hypothetical protein
MTHPAARVRAGARCLLLRLGLVVLALGAIGNLSGCSLSLDTNGAQCARNQDCARFQGAVCDAVTLLCVPGVAPTPTPTPTNAGDPTIDAGTDGDPAGGSLVAGSSRGCRVAAGCAPCAPSPSLELLNGCSDVICVAFDNHMRLSNLGPDGGLAPLP